MELHVLYIVAGEGEAQVGDEPLKVVGFSDFISLPERNARCALLAGTAQRYGTISR